MTTSARSGSAASRSSLTNPRSSASSLAITLTNSSRLGFLAVLRHRECARPRRRGGVHDRFPSGSGILRRLRPLLSPPAAAAMFGRSSGRPARDQRAPESRLPLYRETHRPSGPLHRVCLLQRRGDRQAALGELFLSASCRRSSTMPLAEARKTDFDVQTLGGIKQYLAGYMTWRKAPGCSQGPSVPPGRVRERADADRSAYEHERRSEANRLFETLPASRTSRNRDAGDGLCRLIQGLASEHHVCGRKTQLVTVRHGDQLMTFEQWASARTA